MRIYIFIFIVICELIGYECKAQRLDRFAAKDQSVYSKAITYFGYIDTISEAAEVRNGKKYFSLYFYLPDSVAEIGVRMFSPVPCAIMPDEGDIAADNYYEHEKQKDIWFDTWIAIEYTGNYQWDKSAIIDWTQLGWNDDNKEIFARPDGKSFNSLLRIANADKNLKQLPPGLYRILFTDYKNLNAAGCFAVQLGIKKKMKGLQLVTDLQLLQH